ncbi:MAG: hypothetical protein WCY75_10430 [Sulfurimonadaceae bacterium]|nr:hypothetical protein [Arcobacteraceae bacterium]
MIIIVLTVLIYMKYESNQEKENHQLLKAVMEKPIEQIKQELNPELLKKVRE